MLNRTSEYLVSELVEDEVVELADRPQCEAILQLETAGGDYPQCQNRSRFVYKGRYLCGVHIKPIVRVTNEAS